MSAMLPIVQAVPSLPVGHSSAGSSASSASSQAAPPRRGPTEEELRAVSELQERYPEATNVYFNKLAPECTKGDLASLVSGQGQAILEVRVLLHAGTGLSRGQGFVKYATPEDADAAVARFDDLSFMGRTLQVCRAFDNKRGVCTDHVPTGRIFIRGIPRDVTHPELVAAVEPHATVRGCMMHLDRVAGQSAEDATTRFAYVTVDDDAEATRAAKALNQALPWPCCTRPLLVRVAPQKQKQPKGSHGGKPRAAAPEFAPQPMQYMYVPPAQHAMGAAALPTPYAMPAPMALQPGMMLPQQMLPQQVMQGQMLQGQMVPQQMVQGQQMVVPQPLPQPGAQVPGGQQWLYVPPQQAALPQAGMPQVMAALPQPPAMPQGLAPAMHSAPMYMPR